MRSLLSATVLVAATCGVAPCLAQSIAPGQVVFGALAPGDPVDHRDAHYDCHDFAGVAGQSIEIVMRSIDVDSWIALHRGPGCEGDWEDSDNDSGFGFEEAQLEATLDQGGAWSFRASSADAQDTGPYMVGLAVAGTAQAARLRADPQQITLGREISGELSPTDPARAPGRYFDCYEFSVSGPTQIKVESRSTEFGPRGQVYIDESCRRGRIVELLVAHAPEAPIQQDFAASGLLPRAGRYFLAITSDGLRQTGSYTVTISVTPETQP
jgi:hypothetical protein